jgi:hypothetical protein
MPNTENGRMKVESGVTPFAIQELTQNAGGTQYASGESLWSNNGTKKPVVRVNGIISGGEITPGASDDEVDIAAAVVNLNGVVVTVPSATLSAVRATPTDTHKITSIVVDSGTEIYAVVTGSDDTAFDEARGATGGPPYIPIDEIEIGQVRLSSNVAGPVTESEIFQIPEVHQELASFPGFSIDFRIGAVIPDEAYVASHTGDVRRKVYASFNTATLTNLFRVQAVTMPNTTRSITSEATTDGAVASSTSTLNNGSFTMVASSGITDLILQLKDQLLWVQWQPDRFKAENHKVQGFVNPVVTFGPDSNTSIAITITPEEEGVNLAA